VKVVLLERRRGVSSKQTYEPMHRVTFHRYRSGVGHSLRNLTQHGCLLADCEAVGGFGSRAKMMLTLAPSMCRGRF
jgi:hypothetical protein